MDFRQFTRESGASPAGIVLAYDVIAVIPDEEEA
jgi:hypothetical protein